MEYAKPELLENMAATAAIQSVGKGGGPVELILPEVTYSTPAYEADE